MGAICEKEALPQFARFVSETFGLHFAPERLPELARKMSPLARQAGHQETESYLLQIISSPLSPQLMEELAATLTIGETYFMRDPKSYRALVEQLLPGLVAARRGTKKALRIWSAGCSTGEEPYTIAILLSRMIHDLADWEITILATDLNPQALERARRGLYGQWSFRNTPPWLMEYFEKDGDGRYEIIPRIRRMVRFGELNLADRRAFDKSEIGKGWDIIFCRNVLLYFDARQIEKTVASFHGALRDGGWLFLGPTEIDHGSVQGFDCERHEGTFVLRKLAPGEEPAARVCGGQPLKGAGAALPAPHPAPRRELAKAAPLLAPSHPAQPSLPGEPGAAAAVAPLAAETAPDHGYPEALELYQQGRYQEAAERALGCRGKEEGAAYSLAASAFANIGKFDAARDCCEKAIERDRLKAEYHYLLSIILEQQGEIEAAIRSLKHTLFIDHDYLLAYFALGNLARQCGEQRESERNYNNALRLLERRHPHEALPEADGMTAGRLAQVIRGMSGTVGESV